MLSRDDYRLMEVNLNNKQFLQPLDADNTRPASTILDRNSLGTLARL